MSKVGTDISPETGLRSRRRQARVVAVLAVWVLPFAGCHSAPNADVLATVNGHPILRSEVERMYAAQIADPQTAQQTSRDQASAIRLQALRELIDEEIVEQRAATSLSNLPISC